MVLIIFSLAKRMGVTGTVKIISYDELWSNVKNVKIYWSWIIGHTFITIISVSTLLYSMLVISSTPNIQIQWCLLAITISLIFDWGFNYFIKIPAHIFNKSYNHWLRAVFISLNSIFLLFALSVL